MFYKLFNSIFFIIKIIYGIAWFLWAPFLISYLLSGTPVEIDEVWDFYAYVLQKPRDQLTIKPVEVTEQSNEYEKVVNSTEFYRIVGIIATLNVIIGLLTITRGRSIFEKYLLLTVFAIPQERKYWGTIVNRQSNEAIPFASIRLVGINQDGKEEIIQETISDIDGRYRLGTSKLNLDSYYVEVKAAGYEYYKKVINKNNVMNVNLISHLSLTPLNSKSSYRVKNAAHKIQSFLGLAFMIFIYCISIFTFENTIYNFFLHFGFVSCLNMFFYVHAFPWNTYAIFQRLIFKPGRIVDSNSLKPLRGVVIQSFKEGQQVSSIMTDDTGIPVFNFKEGNYKIKMSKTDYVLNDDPINQWQEVYVNKDGFLTRDVLMTPLKNYRDIEQKSTLLINPFR